ncbi:MAG: MOSC N-terminal beta barrel domain-containing protein [Cytophagales bacterium]|nr:MOSC N-terminal beta barrel domain-containing protein [Bernardetiaceae bacterium]MDW8205662.1 MOSC N-terminal beta barrel domain-containing protein [Cytophagales bacterium]
MPFVENIVVYPIKSMDGLSVRQAVVTKGGSLAWDRQFAFFTAEGKTVNAKKYPTIQQIRADFNLNYGLVTFTFGKQSKTFDLFYDQAAIAQWIGGFLGIAIEMRQNNNSGFPDDRQRSGPTVISTATLQTVANWFGLSVEQTRRRFRANIEIGGCPPFWEDSLLQAPDTPRSFYLGEVEIYGLKACARCPVPSRNPDTGIALAHFQAVFERLRREHLPSFAPVSQFPHYYFLSINTQIPAHQAGKVIQIGDVVSA